MNGERDLISEIHSQSNDTKNLLISGVEESYYQKIKDELKKFVNAFQESEKFSSSSVLEKINISLSEYGLVFITGPILTGKSFLLDIVKTSIKDDLYSKIDKVDITIHKDSINSTRSLYYYWLKAIESQIAKQLSIKIRKPFKFSAKLNLNHKIKNPDNFNTWMNSVGEYGNDLVSFLIMLDEVITDEEVRKCFNKKTNYFITCRLDDMQSHAINSVFFHLKEEIATLPKNLNAEFRFSFKLFIASRYLPQITLKQKSVVYIPPFLKEGVEKISFLLQDEFKRMNSNKEDFDNLVFSKTNGYPWFVIRFFEIYLNIRTTENKYRELSSIELARKIFDMKKFWTEDSIFLNELDTLIRKSNGIERAEIRNYLSSSLSNLNSQLNLNSFPIRQSGFIKIDTASDVFEENECHILQTYYKEEVKKIINEVEPI